MHMCMCVRPTPENLAKIGPLDYGIIEGVSGIVEKIRNSSGTYDPQACCCATAKIVLTLASVCDCVLREGVGV